MHHPRCFIKLLLTGLLLFTGACAPASQNTSYPNQAYPDPVGSPNTATPQATASATALLLVTPTRLRPTRTMVPQGNMTPFTDVPREWTYTATPDPQGFTTVAKIVGDYSQEIIARKLYTKWLDHFLGKNIGDTARLDEYMINRIQIPVDQKCAKKSGGLFFVEVSAILKMASEHSDWGAGSGNTLDDGRLDKPFSGVVYKDGDTYTLKVIFQWPPC